MDTDANDKALILVLCMQARMYSKLASHMREEATKVFDGMRKIVKEMARSKDPRMKKVAAQTTGLIDSTQADLIRLLHGAGDDFEAAL